MDEGAAMCTMHAVVVLCFGCWQGLANRSMRIQDLYVGAVPIPQFIKKKSRDTIREIKGQTRQVY